LKATIFDRFALNIAQSITEKEEKIIPMKTFQILFLVVPLWLVTNANLADITRAISTGDVATLGQYFDESVEVAVLDAEDVYNKTQAVQVLRKFFSEYKPVSFSQVHQGTSKGQDSQYCIGNLTTNSATFRVYIYIKIQNGKHLVQELRFDRT